MSDEITIKSQANGTFTIDTPRASRSATIRHDGGADIVQFTNDSFDANMPASQTQQLLENSGGAVEVGFDGRARALGPQTYQAPVRTADSRMLLASLVDHQGRPCADMRQAVANPENYRVPVSGTQTTLANAMRLGWVNIEGGGNLGVNHENLTEDLHQAPPQPVKAEAFHVNDINFNIAASRLQREIGIPDPVSFAIKYLESGETACKHAADAAGGLADPKGIAGLVEHALQSFLNTAAQDMEAAGMVKRGEGVAALNFVTKGTDPKISRRIVAGMLRGDKRSFQEVVHRYKTGDRW